MLIRIDGQLVIQTEFLNTVLGITTDSVCEEDRTMAARSLKTCIVMNGCGKLYSKLTVNQIYERIVQAKGEESYG